MKVILKESDMLQFKESYSKLSTEDKQVFITLSKRFNNLSLLIIDLTFTRNHAFDDIIKVLKRVKKECFLKEKQFDDLVDLEIDNFQRNSCKVFKVFDNLSLDVYVISYYGVSKTVSKVNRYQDNYGNDRISKKDSSIILDEVRGAMTQILIQKGKVKVQLLDLVTRLSNFEESFLKDFNGSKHITEKLIKLILEKFPVEEPKLGD